MAEIDPLDFARLRQFDTPTVLNVIELFDVRPRDAGFVDGSIRAVYPELPPVVAYAATATFRSSRPPAGEDGSYSNFIEQVDSFIRNTPEPRMVVFEDLDPEPVGATFGEVMCSVYKAFGCVGLITSGAARDVDQVRALAFPCWASSVIASHACCRIVEIDVPVTVGGCEIHMRDIIHADANGIATIPGELVREVALGCQLLAEAENEVLHYVRAGKPTVEGLRAARRRSIQAMEAIPERVREMLRP